MHFALRLEFSNLGAGSSAAEQAFQLFIRCASKIPAQCFIVLPLVEIAAQQPLHGLGNLSCEATIGQWTRDAGMSADSAADGEQVGIDQPAIGLDLFAFETDVRYPVLAAAVGAAGNMQPQWLIELRQPGFHLIDNPARKTLGLGNCQLAELGPGAGDCAFPEYRTFNL